MANNNFKSSPPSNLPTQDSANTNINTKSNNLNQEKLKSTAPDNVKANSTTSNVISKESSLPQQQISDMDINKKEISQPSVVSSPEVPRQVAIQPPENPPNILDSHKSNEMQQLDDTTVESLERRSRIIRLVILIVSAIIVVGLIAAGIYLYNNWLKGASIDTIKEEQEAEEKSEDEPDDKTDDETGDRDGDGIPDWWEIKYGLDPADPSDAAKDFDFDGLTNLEEYLYGTDPRNPDTDGDGYSDGEEVKAGFNPAGPGRLKEEIDNQTSNTAFLAGNWTGNMQGRFYSFSDLSVSLRSDGNLSLGFNIDYNEEKVESDGVGKFEVKRETGGLKSQINMQGVAESGVGAFELNFSGNVRSNNNEITGTWYIIPAKLSAPWMIQDNGTFSWKRP